jgi:hypothetical protein
LLSGVGEGGCAVNQEWVSLHVVARLRSVFAVAHEFHKKTDKPCVSQETVMGPNPASPAIHPSHDELILRRLLAGMSIFTMLMTIPQVLTIWFGQQAAGVSILSWSAYLLSAVLWFWFGIQKHDKNIYLP